MDMDKYMGYGFGCYPISIAVEEVLEKIYI